MRMEEVTERVTERVMERVVGMAVDVDEVVLMVTMLPCHIRRLSPTAATQSLRMTALAAVAAAVVVVVVVVAHNPLARAPIESNSALDEGLWGKAVCL